MKRLRFLQLAKSLAIGLAASFQRHSPSESVPAPLVEEWKDLDKSIADYVIRERPKGSVAYNYSGPMIRLDQGGMLDRTSTWKTVTDRDLRNRCIEGTGWSESET